MLGVLNLYPLSSALEIGDFRINGSCVFTLGWGDTRSCLSCRATYRQIVIGYLSRAIAVRKRGALGRSLCGFRASVSTRGDLRVRKVR